MSRIFKSLILTGIMLFLGRGVCYAEPASWEKLSSCLEGKRSDIFWTAEFHKTAKAGKPVKEYSMSGRLLLQGGCFMLESDMFKIYNDGHSICILNLADREITIEEGFDAAALLSDPEKLTSQAGLGKKLESLSVNFNGSVPSGIDAVLSNGSSINIVFNTFHQSSPTTDEDFTLNIGRLDSSYKVTDLR